MHSYAYVPVPTWLSYDERTQIQQGSETLNRSENSRAFDGVGRGPCFAGWYCPFLIQIPQREESLASSAVRLRLPGLCHVSAMIHPFRRILIMMTACEIDIATRRACWTCQFALCTWHFICVAPLVHVPTSLPSARPNSSVASPMIELS